MEFYAVKKHCGRLPPPLLSHSTETYNMSATDKLKVIDVIESAGVEPSIQATLKARFLPFFEQAEQWKAKAEMLVVTNANQTREMKMAREARLALRAIRVEADKTRKALKEDSLRYGRAVQGVYNVIEYIIKPIEEHLQAQEDFVKIQEAKRREELNDARIDELAAWVDFAWPVSFSSTPYGDMSEGEWSVYLQAAKDAKEAYEQAEAERIAREKAEAEERERIRRENERLRAEAAERERQIAEERRKLEEQARKEREAAQAALRAEQEARAKAEAEAREAKEGEERKRKEAEEQARKLAAAPDREKLTAWAAKIENTMYELPECSTKEAKAVAQKIAGQLANSLNMIRQLIDTL